jgi:hypothetical protein
MRRVFFTGAGGVGKTSVLVNLEKKLTDSGIRFVTFLSVSREFFKKMGLTTEQAGLERRESDRKAFQKELFQFYTQKLADAQEEAKASGVQVFMADRSPHDHLAYLVYNSPNLLTMDELQELRLKACRLFDSRHLDGGSVCACSVFHFPCVTPWIGESSTKDGMRHAPPGKNFMIDALIESFSADIDGYSHSRERIVADSTVEERADFILYSLLPYVNMKM